MLKKIVVILFILTVNSGFAQDSLRHVKQLTLEDGLSQSTVNCIFQDSYGFMWFGTQSGLNKYDGKKFRIYSNNPLDSTSISNNWIFSISEDNDRNLWIGTRNGLNRFNRNTETFESIVHDPANPNSLHDNSVYSVLVDSKENVWVKTSRMLSKYVVKEKKFYHYPNYLESFTLSRSEINFPIIEDHEGKIWVGSKVGLDYFDPLTEDLIIFTHDQEDTTTITHNHITALYQDSDLNIWVATQNGLCRYNWDKKNFSQLHFYSNEFGEEGFNYFSSITEDSEGNLWLGTQGRGVIRLKTDIEAGTDSASRPLSSNLFRKKDRDHVVYSLLQDKSRNLWIGTDVHGLYKVDLKPKKIEVYTSGSVKGLTLPTNTISSIHIDRSGKFWIGARGHGLIVYDKKKKKSEIFSTSQKLSRKLLNDFVHTIYEDTQGRVWLGTRNGINIYDPKTDKLSTLSDYFDFIFYSRFSNKRINSIREDSHGNMWVASNEGLHMFNLETLEVESFHHDALDKGKISHNIVYDVAEAHDGKIWVATFGGLNLLDPSSKRAKRFGEDHFMGKIGESCSYSLAVDGDDVLWVGTVSGLNRIDIKKKKLILYSTEQGLPSNAVFKVVKSKNNQIWGSTGRGLFSIDLNSGEVTSFDRADGLKNLEFNTGVGEIAPDGTIYFGSVSGYVAIKPEKIIQNQIIPPVRITDIHIISKEGKRRAKIKDGVLNLRYNDYDFSIDFAALDYTAPNKNNYAYRMLGLGDEWVNVGNRSFVSFSRLSPGTYRFQVQGSNNDNFWNRIGDELIIVVQPPWWRKPYAYFFYVLMSGLTVYGFILFRERRLRHAKLQLQKSVKMRTLKIEQQKEEISSQRDLAIQQRGQIQKQNEELADTLSQLKAAQKQLVESEKMASLGSLVAGVSHEINTPVGIGITASSSILERTKEFAKLYAQKKMSAKELQEYLKSVYQGSSLILNNLQRTGELVRSFKQISVDESTEQIRRFVLKEYLLDVIRSLQPKFKNRPIQFDVSCAPEIEPKTYPGALAQIFTNLIINSLKHAFSDSQEGEISIKCERNNNLITIWYKDSGSGIPEEVRERIFDPFFTTDMQSGTGLGMHIVYNLVTQKLKGSIKCLSEEQGACFSLSFPEDVSLSSNVVKPGLM